MWLITILFSKFHCLALNTKKVLMSLLKSGLTPMESEKVEPARVKESPVQFECIVKDVVELGQSGGAGNLVISEVVLMHIDEAILDDDGKINQQKIDLVGRMGKNWYTRSRKWSF